MEEQAYVANSQNLNKHLSQAYVERALIRLQAKYYREALDDFIKANKLVENPFNYNNIGYIYTTLNSFHDAIHAYSKALFLDKNQAVIYGNRAAAYLEIKEYHLALKDCSNAVTLEPKSTYYKALLKKIQDSVSGVTEVDQPQEINNLWFVININLLNKIDETTKKIVEVYFLKITNHIQLESYQQALEEVNLAIGESSQDCALYNTRGFIQAKLKRYVEALHDFCKAMHLSPNNPVVYYNRAVLYAELNQFDKAINDIDQAIMIKPENVTYKSFRFMIETQILKLQTSEFNYSSTDQSKFRIFNNLTEFIILSDLPIDDKISLLDFAEIEKQISHKNN